MENLSIVIREECSDKIYKYIELLYPILSDNKSQLIIINNTLDKLNISYDHTIYKYNESYKDFKEFCFTVCLKENIMIIENGVELSREIIEDIYRNLQIKQSNYIVKFKRFIDNSGENYYIKDDTLVFNISVNRKSVSNLQLNDFRYLHNNERLENKIIKFIQDEEFHQLYMWYNFNLKNDKERFNFYETLESIKITFNDNINSLIENEFVNVSDKYSAFLTLQRSIKNLTNNNIFKIIDILGNYKFTKEEKYFTYFLLEAFKQKAIILDVLNKIQDNNLPIFIDYIFELDKDGYINIYNFITTLNIKKEMNKKNYENIKLYIKLIKIYIRQMSNMSADKLKKDMLIQMFVEYSNYSLYLLSEFNNESFTNAEITFLTDLQKAIDKLNFCSVKDAISILNIAAEKYSDMEMATRYYAQKLIYDNKLYSNKLSICMIVKNEEKNIRRCLESLKPLTYQGFAELIVVDTGSEDKTVEIAKEYTNKVYYHPWKGSFSEARNYSLSLAAGEYIFIVDADNEMEKSELDKVLTCFKGNEYKKYAKFMINVKNFSDEKFITFSMMTQALIFKNNGGFYYSGKVHNQPMCKGPLKYLDITILHYGYIMTEDIKDKKFYRTAELLKKELEKSPRNLYYRMQLSTSYSMHGDKDKALEQVQIYLKDLQKKDDIRENDLMLYNNAVIIYLTNGMYEDTLQICDKVLNKFSDFIDFIYNKAVALCNLENYKESIFYIEAYLKLLKEIDKHSIMRDPRHIFYTLDCEQRAKNMLLMCYYELEDYNNLLACSQDIVDCEVLKDNLYLIISSYLKSENYQGLAKFFKYQISNSKNSDLQIMFNYIISQDMKELAKEIINKIYQSLKDTNVSEEVINTIQFLISSQKDDELFFDFIKRYDLNNIDIITSKILIDNILPILSDYKIEEKYSVKEISILKDCSRFILNKTLNTKQFKGLTQEELLDILNKYISFCVFLQKGNETEFLNEKESKFIEYIMKALNCLENGDLINAIRKIKDGVIVYNEMARPMELYLGEILNNQELDIKENKVYDNQEDSLNQYSIKVKEKIGRLINNGSLNEALNLIEEYEKLIDKDIEIYSMKSVVLIQQNKILDAKEVIEKGLQIDKNNFDLLYNLAYIHEILQEYTQCQMFYNKSLNYCKDKNIKLYIKEKLSQLEKIL